MANRSIRVGKVPINLTELLTLVEGGRYLVQPQGGAMRYAEVSPGAPIPDPETEQVSFYIARETFGTMVVMSGTDIYVWTRGSSISLRLDDLPDG